MPYVSSLGDGSSSANGRAVPSRRRATGYNAVAAHTRGRARPVGIMLSPAIGAAVMSLGPVVSWWSRTAAASNGRRV